MENKSTNSEFENFMRKNLQQVDDTPDGELWDKIAAAQTKPNWWMKIRHYSWYAGAAILLLSAAIGLYQYTRPSSLPVYPQNALEQPTLTPETADQPMAETAVPELSRQVNTNTTNTIKTALVPNFGPRVNSVPAMSVRFNAANGLRYQSPSTGTVVSIPANSLVDQQGNPVKGDAELFLREYRSIEDYLASGLPMHYADGRGEFFFNSGGMFEVRVSQNGDALQMAPGRAYQLTFSPTSELEKASLYYLDDQTADWEFVPDAAFGQADLSQPPVATETEAVSGQKRQNNDDCLPRSYEIAGVSNTADMVKLGVKTGYELATGKIAMPRWFLKNPYLSDDQLLFRMERGTIQIKKHRDKAQLFFPEDLDKYFTELDAFKNCYFSFTIDPLGGGSGTTTKKLSGISDEFWQRIVIEQIQQGECIITLYDGKEGQLQFHALLRGNTENKKFDPEKVMKEYERLREKRQQDFAEKNKALRYFLQAAPPFNPKEERCMSEFQWLEYFEKNHTLMAKRYQKLIDDGYAENDALAQEAWSEWRKVMRESKFQSRNRAFENGKSTALTDLTYSLSLYRFGVYNCDQIFRLSAGQKMEYVLAIYKTASGEKVIPATISVLDKGAKLFFTQPNAQQLLYLQGRRLDFIITDRDGRQFHLPADQYAERVMTRGSVNSLTVQDVTAQTDSPKAWADLLEM